MSVNVLKPGLLTTIQDMGRFGFQRHGVIVGGAMDTLALRVANILVGNDESLAVMEITMKGPTLEFTEDALISICGGDLSPTMDHQPISMGKPFFVPKGSVIKFGACVAGCRAYLAIAGGFEVPPVMESRSTYLRAKIGGFNGRPLQTGDTLSHGQLSEYSTRLLLLNISGPMDWSISRDLWSCCEHRSPLRLISGAEYPFFTEQSREALYKESFRVTPQSDRMGYRLQGPQLGLEQPLELLSHGVTAGTIQVPPAGDPIILLADRQTTGGYPKIGNVISVDLPRLAQAKPGDCLRFQEVSLEEAQSMYIRREQQIKWAKQGLKLMLRG